MEWRRLRPKNWISQNEMVSFPLHTFLLTTRSSRRVVRQAAWTTVRNMISSFHVSTQLLVLIALALHWQCIDGDAAKKRTKYKGKFIKNSPFGKTKNKTNVCLKVNKLSCFHWHTKMPTNKKVGKLKLVSRIESKSWRPRRSREKRWYK